MEDWSHIKGAQIIQLRDNKGVICGQVVYKIAADECEIYDIYVEIQQRQQGIGQKLLTKCLDDCGKQNVRVIFLEVAHNNQAAINLYKKMNFTVYGRRAKYYKDGMDAILMNLAVS